MSSRIAILAMSAASLALGACGGDGSEAEGSSAPQRVEGNAELATDGGKSGEPAATAQRAKPKKPTVVKVEQSQYGDVLFDAKGFVLYLFTKDGGPKSKCYGDCATAWPPYLKKGPLEARDGVDQSALGKSERRDGSKQVTYHGHPLYYYEGDDSPGQILCHDVQEFGGGWFVVQPDGKPAP